MLRKPRSTVLVVACLSCMGSASFAQSPFSMERMHSQNEVRRSVFSIGIQGDKHDLKAGNGDELIGNSAAVQLGTGYIADKWYTSLSLDIILGPYEPVRNKELNTDFVGTGLTWFTGISAQTQNLRSPAGGYGFALGLSYADIVGRTVSSRNKDTRSGTGESGETIDNYIMRVNRFSMIPAIFFSWLQGPRPAGNSPDLLTTRLEGYLMTIGVAIPLITTYSSRYNVRNNAPTTEAVSTTREEKDSGQLRGYSVLCGITAFLGT
jgi:hypothetical protein